MHRFSRSPMYPAVTLWIPLAGLLRVASLSVAAAESPAPAARAPYFLTDLKETARVARLSDGTLLAIFTRSSGRGRRSWRLASRAITAGPGETPQTLTPLPQDDVGWSGAEPLVDRDGELHIFFLKSRKKKPSGLDIDIWHMTSSDGRRRWQSPRRIWKGYTGALNGTIQMRSGRILVPFSYMTDRTWANRGEGFDQFTYMGTFNCTVLYSDDRGATWRESPTPLKVTAPDLGTYGAIEPVVVERGDGRVWMLLRTQHGRFYESLSDDGADLVAATPVADLFSDSPAGLTRLDDGRIVLLWNNCLRFPYAYGGRHVLHGAISGDDGKTCAGSAKWRATRSATSRRRRPATTAPPTRPVRGQRQQGHQHDRPPQPELQHVHRPRVVLRDGSGRGLPGRAGAVVGLRRQGGGPRSPSSASGPQGAGDPQAEPRLAGRRGLELPFRSQGIAAAAALAEGGLRRARIGITDHFSVPFDDLDEFHNLFNLAIAADGSIPGGRQRQDPDRRWSNLEFAWDGAERRCLVTVDGRRAASLYQNRESLGANYLRIVSTAATTDEAGLLVERVESNVEPGP